jgi:uncharacterized protein
MTAMQRLACDFQVKFAGGDDGAMTFEGYGAVFGNVDHHGDVIRKGAFRETIREAKRGGPWPAMLAQHGGLFGDNPTPIGVWTALDEDEVGLRVEGRLADTERGREAYALLRMQPRPAYDGLSIGYVAKQWTSGTKPEEPRRTLETVRLMEISLVTFPANERARVSAVKSGMTERDAERALRDAGFSRTEAKAIVAEGFKGLALRDAAADASMSGLLEAIRASQAAFTAS